MKIKYFSGTDLTPDKLKARRNELFIKHHPDKFPDNKKEIQHAIMIEINAEYDYLCNYKPPIKEPVLKGKFDKFAHDEEIKIQAQNIFNSLTKKKIDYDGLISTINNVKDWKELFKVYSKTYGTSMTIHIISGIKDTALRNKILKQIAMYSSDIKGLVSVFNIFKKYF